jgi:hypothetical protein
LLIVTTMAFGANRYAVANGKWNDTTTWSATSGGTSGASAPTSADDVYLGELTARSITVKNATAQCNNLYVYSGSTLDRAPGNGTLSVYGNISNNGTITNSSNQDFNFTFAGTATHSLTGSGTWSGKINYIIPTNAVFDLGTQVFGGGASAKFTLQTGATLVTAHPDGINGNLTMTGTISLNTGANYVFNGSAAQVTGTLLPTTVNNLTFSNSAQVTLSQNVAVTGAATVTSGTLEVGTNVISGTGSFTLNSGTTLATGNTSGVNGSITTSTYSFNTAANYTFNGTSVLR